MKNVHKIRGKREFLFDDRELIVLGGGALIICVLIFVLGVLVGQSLQEQSVAGPLTPGAELREQPPATADDQTSQDETLLAENQTQEQPENSQAQDGDTFQRSYYQVLPDSETYVEVEATPEQQTSPEPSPTSQPQTSPTPAAGEASPPPSAEPTSAEPPPDNVALVPALPNVPKDPSDEIRLGRQQQVPGNAPLGGAIYSVQVASSTDREDSERLVQKYGERGYQAYVMVADLGEKGIWYRVRVGNLATREEAGYLRQEILQNLPDLANDPYVIKVSE
ncbi:hypothetical protein GF339_22095 [candidate division KSB3 bacterium]|uniref:SPOR domain-containing protein n=1 Tax=candidate division KSB3 bacterium TaxID=2044937 RepID=A0A9D5JZM6_9BACT|nr:hypothetical protein [candidate division KSB3 bacterium]MBD3327294.1 hypothetical protein [candidate division KSB3 bacterium]